MEILKSKGFDFIALAKDDVGILSVVCGTSAFFEVRLTMPLAQLAALLANADELARLLDDVRLAPGRHAASTHGHPGLPSGGSTPQETA